MTLLLFLDFDGVLHPVRSQPAQHFDKLPRLESVLREFPRVRLVISSSWQDAYSLRTLKQNFSADIVPRIVGATRSADPDGEAESRFDAINRYLRHNGHAGAPWLALDDAADEFPSDCPQLVLCAPETGFDDEAAARLRLILAEAQSTLAASKWSR